MTATSAKQTGVIILAIFLLISGILSLGTGLIPLSNRLLAGAAGIPTWAMYLNILVGVLEIISGILVMMRKRAGLLLGSLVYIVAIVGAILSVISGQVINGVILGIVIAMIGLVMLVRGLTSEPQKSMFA